MCQASVCTQRNTQVTAQVTAQGSDLPHPRNPSRMLHGQHKRDRPVKERGLHPQSMCTCDTVPLLQLTLSQGPPLGAGLEPVRLLRKAVRVA